MRPGSQRLEQLDALRGIAALVVVLFHFTFQFNLLYGHVGEPLVSVPWGHYGVNLFFMISGFVIFMTLSRTQHVADFIVSRFSRLYPAYWVAIALTLLIVGLLGLPGKEVGVSTALLNLLMFQGLFKVANVDGVYWTLVIELLFYGWALLAYVLGWLHRVHTILAAALLLRLVYFFADRLLGIELPWTISQLLILPYIAWFACGIMVYRLTQLRDKPRSDGLVIAGAIAVLAITESPGLALFACVLTAMLYLAALGRLSLLSLAVFTWLGDISYTLYLLHENIGWALMLRLEAAGVNSTLAIGLVLLAVLALASAVTRIVEKPAMAWIRSRYKRHRAALAA